MRNRQQVRAHAARDNDRAASSRDCAAARAAAIETARIALAPSFAFVRRAVQLDHLADRWRLLVRLRMPMHGRRDLLVDVLHGLARALAEVALGSLSRSSTASCSPVEAPDGTAARPTGPSARCTSASTVGLPRESRISRPMTLTISISFYSNTFGRRWTPIHADQDMVSAALPRTLRFAKSRSAAGAWLG